MKKGSKHVHDYRYTHADRAEIYESLVKNPKSTLASPEQYARIPLKGMPSPTGKVYRGDDTKKSIEEILKFNVINEKDIKMQILEPVKYNWDFIEHESKVWKFNKYDKNCNFDKYWLPTGVYIKENNNNETIISKQNIHVFGDFEDKIIIAENENSIKITNRDLSKNYMNGFIINFNKNTQEFYIIITIPETRIGFMSYRNRNKEPFDVSYEDICLKLTDCFKKLYCVPNINEFINLNNIEQNLFYAISIDQHGELATKIVDMIKQHGKLHLNLEQILSQYCRSDFKDNILISDSDNIENRNNEMNNKSQTLVKRKYL